MAGDMRPPLDLTSVPPWATAATRPPADTSGRAWTIVSFGADDVVREWTRQLRSGKPDAAVRTHRVRDDAEARAAVEGDLADAVVGWRLLVAGPADACLRVRALALRLGVNDDELTVATVDVGVREVHCAHCGVTTRTDADLEQVIACAGCDRKLLVYYHVSRRIGAHLGFLAEEAP
jgi:hypothetical protein